MCYQSSIVSWAKCTIKRTPLISIICTSKVPVIAGLIRVRLQLSQQDPQNVDDEEEIGLKRKERIEDIVWDGRNMEGLQFGHVDKMVEWFILTMCRQNSTYCQAN